MAQQALKAESGKTFFGTYNHPVDMTGGKLYFTIKVDSDTDLTDTTALAQATITSFTNGGKTATWTLTDTQMNILPDDYQYDIVYENSSGQSLPALFYGKFTIVKRMTNRNI